MRFCEPILTGSQQILLSRGMGTNSQVGRSTKRGVTLSKRAMQAVEARLERHPELPYWDMLIRPASTS